MADWGRFFGTAIVVGFIGPAFWLSVKVLENWLQRKGFPLAGFDLLSWRHWRERVLHRRPGGPKQEARALGPLRK